MEFKGFTIFIRAKWGDAEVIESVGADAYEGAYGSPVAYFTED
jgi:hypothetical protein